MPLLSLSLLYCRRSCCFCCRCCCCRCYVCCRCRCRCRCCRCCRCSRCHRCHCCCRCCYCCFTHSLPNIVTHFLSHSLTWLLLPLPIATWFDANMSTATAASLLIHVLSSCPGNICSRCDATVVPAALQTALPADHLVAASDNTP